MKGFKGTILIFLLLLIAVALLLSPAGSYAISIGGVAGSASGALSQSGYGGKVLFVFPCTCNTNGSFQVILGPPSAGLYYFDPTKVLQKPYPYGMWIVPGAWHLGMRSVATNPAQCRIYLGEGCGYLPTTYNILWAGTSLPGL